MSAQFFEAKFPQAEMIQQIFLTSEKLFQIPESSEWDELVHCKEFMSPIFLFKLIRSICYIYCSWQLKKYYSGDLNTEHPKSGFIQIPYSHSKSEIFVWYSDDHPNKKFGPLNVHVIKSLLNHLNLEQYCLEFRSHS